MIILEIFLSFTMPLAVQNEGTYLLWVSLTYWIEGGHFTLIPAIYKKIFGDDGARVFGIGFSFLGIASIFQIGLISTLAPYLGIGGFYYLFGVFCIVSLILLLCVFEQKEVVFPEDDEEECQTECEKESQ
jgi:hypothetical protein